MSNLPSMTRKIKLDEWTSVLHEMPPIGAQVWICDSDEYGFADYEFIAVFTGNFEARGLGIIEGVTYWKHIIIKAL